MTTPILRVQQLAQPVWSHAMLPAKPCNRTRCLYDCYIFGLSAPRKTLSEADILLLALSGWPLPPALQPACGACIAGWASVAANASYCTLCGPGTFAATLRSPACAPCPAGTYASSWGSSHCRSCVLGAFQPVKV